MIKVSTNKYDFERAVFDCG